ncbi:type II toxin-antitoxin system death-on-curing family toxin [Streptomyces sp. NPDC007883]|uniref:type II toxin-antitoxin system death-on-curing family toxin n=1 Tax=Streptomyces sp. NPDC007883 TaxID=3155116 RepID=UPI0033CFC7DE
MTHQTTSQTRHLTVSEVTAIARFAFGGHPPELRAGGLLESAVHRPRSRMYGVAAYPDLWEQAGALLHAIASNHPFVDGNKRTAWLSTAVFLALNGADPVNVDQDRAYDLVVSVAAGQMSDPALIGAVLRTL